MLYKNDVCKLLFLLGIVLFTVLENSEGIEEIHNEAEEAQNNTFSSNQYTYEEIELELNSTDSEKDSVSSLNIGRFPAAAGEIPYQVSLRNTSGQHFCGGSIISNRWILTSAYCVRGKTPPQVIVVVGAYLLNSGGTSYGVDRIIQHPLYDPTTITHDIAVIKVIGSIVFTFPYVNKIRMAALPTLDRTLAILSGWGSTMYPPGNEPNHLQYNQVEALPPLECVSQLPETTLTLGNLCALMRTGDGCVRDSGGPLVEIFNGPGKQIGIVSGGEPCAVGKPDLYTSVAVYHIWVLRNTGIVD